MSDVLATGAGAWLPAAGIVLLGLGMALIIGGVVVPGLFMPGGYVLVLGFIVLFAAALLAMLPRPSA
jgi:hypothetical protein